MPSLCAHPSKLPNELVQRVCDELFALDDPKVDYYSLSLVPSFHIPAARAFLKQVASRTTLSVGGYPVSMLLGIKQRFPECGLWVTNLALTSCERQQWSTVRAIVNSFSSNLRELSLEGFQGPDLMTEEDSSSSLALPFLPRIQDLDLAAEPLEGDAAASLSPLEIFPTLFEFTTLRRLALAYFFYLPAPASSDTPKVLQTDLLVQLSALTLHFCGPQVLDSLGSDVLISTTSLKTLSVAFTEREMQRGRIGYSNVHRFVCAFPFITAFRCPNLVDIFSKAELFREFNFKYLSQDWCTQFSQFYLDCFDGDDEGVNGATSSLFGPPVPNNNNEEDDEGQPWGSELDSECDLVWARDFFLGLTSADYLLNCFVPTSRLSKALYQGHLPHLQGIVLRDEFRPRAKALNTEEIIRLVNTKRDCDRESRSLREKGEVETSPSVPSILTLQGATRLCDICAAHLWPEFIVHTEEHSRVAHGSGGVLPQWDGVAPAELGYDPTVWEAEADVEEKDGWGKE